MGRGGAGNWYQPTELRNEGTFSQPADSTAIPTSSKPQVSTPWHPEGQELPVARSGRGGAGNFVWKSEEQGNREREDEERRKESVREEAERSVEAGLAKPPGVLLGKETERGW
jgi:GTPase involved in cell partitioning and DNA repair